MGWMTMQPKYFEFLYQRNWMTWIGAGALALGMNLVLFALMPNLLHRSSSPPVFDTLVPQVNVIRIKRTDTPVKHKTPNPPKSEAKKIRPPEPTLRQTLNRRLCLPFEVNTKLPAGPSSLELPVAPMVLDKLDLEHVFTAGDLDQPLITLTRIPPFYPMTAKRRGIQGWVNVKFVVNEQGRVENVSIINAQPPGIFDASVMRCLSGWYFRPGTVQGEPVKVWAETTIRFELE
jgi:periplasmic protein TonB